MKIGGEEINKPNEDILVIPRGKGSPIVFEGQAIMDFTVFNALCPMPEAPTITTRTKGTIKDEKDKGFMAQMNNYVAQKTAWMIIETLKPSNIEWDSIDPEKPATWVKWSEDMANAGFTAAEQQRIMTFVIEVNSLSESKLEQARADFLRGQMQESPTE